MENENLNINYDLIKNFVYVAKYKSYSKASKVLFLTQSALSQSISRLEKQLNVKLFYRTNGEILLTNEGKALYEECSKGERSFRLGINHVLNFNNFEKKKIRIKVDKTLANLFLYKKMNAILKSFPEYNVEIVRAMHDYNSVDEMLENAVDICITESIISHKFIDSFKLSDMNIEFLYNPNLISINENSITEKMIVINNRSELTFPYLKYLKERNISSIIEVPHYEMIIDMIRCNPFIGVAPKEMDEDEILRPLAVKDLDLRKFEVYAYTNNKNEMAKNIIKILTVKN